MPSGGLPDVASWPFVGRDEELEWAEAARKHPGSIGLIVSGAAGVGKTRLAREVLAAAADRNATEWIQATQAAASIPLGAVAGLVPSGVRAEERLHLFQLCAEALRERALEQPLVLGVDDGHLLDPSSAALVFHVAETRTAFVVVTVRAGERCPDAIVALWKDLEAPRLELQQLSEDETLQLLEAALGGELSSMVRRWAYTTSEGHVLYLRELVKGALATGALVREDGQWRLRSRPRASPALVDLISRSLNDLDDDQLEAARVLALGEPLGLDTLARLAGPASVSELESRELAVVARAPAPSRAHEVRLSHPLYGEVLRERTPTVRGIDLRLRLAEAVRAKGLHRPGEALKVATWLEDAGADLDEPLLLAAAHDANGGGDPDLAERFVRRTAAALSAEGALILARAQALRRRFGDGEALLAEWEGRMATKDLAEHYLRERALWIQHQGLRHTDEALRLLDRATAWFADAEWRDRVDSIRLMILATNRGAGPSQVIEAAEKVLQDDHLVPDIRRLATLAYAFSLHDVGRSADALPLTDRFPLAVPLRDDADVYAFSIWTMVRLEAGYEWGQAERWLLDADRGFARVDDPLSQGQIAVALSQFALARGMPQTAVRRARESIAYMPRPDPSRRLPTLAWLCLVIGEAMRGDVRAAHDAHASYRASIAEAPVGYLQPQEIVARAALTAAEGDLPAAGRVLMDGAAANEGMLIDQAHLLYAALRIGVAPATIAAQLAAIASAVAVPLVEAFASHARALASGDAAALLATANALAEIGAWLWAAEAAGQAAVAHTRDGRGDSARRAMARRGDLYAKCEGARSPVLATVDLAPAELTERELEVTNLAARGATNAEIAERLVLSVRTVESHLYRAMRKLGVSAREELRAG